MAFVLACFNEIEPIYRRLPADTHMFLELIILAVLVAVVVLALRPPRR